MEKSKSKIEKYNAILIFLLGFFCTINGFFFKIGNLNLRVCDVVFFIYPIYWLILGRHLLYRFSKNIILGVSLICVIFIYFIISGLLNYESYPEIYQEFFRKYIINKTLWIPIYIMLFFMIGGMKNIKYFFWGIAVCSVINGLLIIYEWQYISNGSIPEYRFVSYLFLQIDPKKFDVINQNMIRPTGLMLDPNYTGGYCGIGVLFFDYLYNKYKRYKYIVLEIICAIPLFILFSRTGLFSIFICFLFSLLLFSGRNKIKGYHILYPQLIIILVLSAVLLLSYLWTFDEKFVEDLLDRLIMDDSSSSTRTDYISFYIKDANVFKILFGSGYLSGGSSIDRIFGDSTIVWSPESNWITFFFELGFVFVVLYFLFLVYIYFRLLRLNYFFANVFLYINLIGVSYNFLGDRVYFLLTTWLVLYCFSSRIIGRKGDLKGYNDRVSRPSAQSQNCKTNIDYLSFSSIP